jgi:hypothetical protein
MKGGKKLDDFLIEKGRKKRRSKRSVRRMSGWLLDYLLADWLL